MPACLGRVSNGYELRLPGKDHGAFSSFSLSGLCYFVCVLYSLPVRGDAIQIKWKKNRRKTLCELLDNSYSLHVVGILRSHTSSIVWFRYFKSTWADYIFKAVDISFKKVHHSRFRATLVPFIQLSTSRV